MKKNILLIDDDLNHTAELAIGLVGAGYQVIPEIEADSALAVLRGKEMFDLIIIDFAMPGLNAASIMGMLRQSLPNVPVIVLSRRASADNYIKAMGHGAFEYMSKPVRVNQLRRVIDAALMDSERNKLSEVLR